MGLFGSPQKTEAKADAALAKGDVREAYQLFREALRQVKGKDPEAAARLSTKVEDARLRFIHQQLAEMRAYLDDGIADAALETLGFVRDNLTPADTELAAQAKALEARAREMQEGPARVVKDPVEDDVPVVVGGLIQEEDAPEEAEALIPADADPHELFEQFSGALPEEDRERAEKLSADFRVGFVHLQLGDLDKALQSFQRAAEANPREPLVLEQLAAVLDQSGKPGEAEQYYRQALGIDPKRMNARLALAAMLGGASSPDPTQPPQPPRDTDAALALLEEGLKADPQIPAPYLMAAADVALTAGRREVALDYAKRSLAAGADEVPEAWLLYGLTLEATRAIPEAADAYERAVRLGGNAMLPRARFAEFALRHNHALEKAQEIIFETCMACRVAVPGPETLAYYGFLLSRIQFARGKYKDALEGAQRLLKQGPPEAMTNEMKRLIADSRAAIEAAKRRREEPEEEESEGEEGQREGGDQSGGKRET